MKQQINVEVSVVMCYSARKHEALPYLISWQNREYVVGKLGYHQPVKHVDTLHHIFSVVDKDNTLCFHLNLNTSNLHWTLEAVHDGLAH